MANRATEGSERIFSPNGIGDPNVVAAVGRVVIVNRVEERALEADLSPLYLVQNIENGVYCYAFGDELSFS